MGVLLLSIIFNTYIGVAFKFFEKWNIRILQAIVVNYFVCAITASIYIGRPAVTSDIIHKDWFFPALALGLTFILTFNLLAITVQKVGVVITTVFQKMSMIAPILVAIIAYNESASLLKISGILLAIIAILVINSEALSKSTTNVGTDKWIWILPIITFLGHCLVDFGIFYVDASGLANSNDIDFIASLFFCAGCFGIVFLIIDYIKNKTTYRWIDVLAGIMLGVPNFFTIFFLLKALEIGLDGSVVFPINNIGILILSALVGVFLFREHMNVRKFAGLILAILAIILISIA